MKRCIKRTFKYLAWFLIFSFLITIATPFIPFLKNRSIKNQIRFIHRALERGADDDLQNRYPEGKIFSNALLALSIIKYGEKHDIDRKWHARSIDNCLQRIMSKSAKEIFPNNLTLPYGAFYNGWLNFVLKKFIESPLFEYSTYQKEFIKRHEEITNRIIDIQRDSLQLLESYAHATWPADNVACIASLGDADEELSRVWLDLLFSTSASDKTMICHFLDRPYEFRGSSQSLMLYFLNQIQARQFQAYAENHAEYFIDTIMGIQFVKEHMDGDNDLDIDSGPIILGYGSVATIMNVISQKSMGQRHADKTWAFLNVLGLPINIRSKYYLLQQEPMYDIFMLWGSVQ